MYIVYYHLYKRDVRGGEYIHICLCMDRTPLKGQTRNWWHLGDWRAKHMTPCCITSYVFWITDYLNELFIKKIKLEIQNIILPSIFRCDRSPFPILPHLLGLSSQGPTLPGSLPTLLKPALNSQFMKTSFPCIVYLAVVLLPSGFPFLLGPSIKL